MNKFFMLGMAALLAFAMVFVGCEQPTDNETNNSGGSSTSINIAAIAGVSAPVTGGTPAATVATDQYIGTIAWSPELEGGKFKAATAYIATITLAAKTGYTFIGVPENSFTVAGAAVAINTANSGVVTVVFPSTGGTTGHPFGANAAIAGVTAPVVGETAATTVTETEQYTGTVTWLPELKDGTFNENTAYTAIIALTAQTGFSFTGVPANSLTVAGAAAANAADSGSVTAVFPATGGTAERPNLITLAAIGGVTAPVTGETPVTAITENVQYSGTVEWSPALENGTFKESTAYTATITLTEKTGFTLQVVLANFFTVEGAAATNAVNNAVVTAVFPATGGTVATPDPITLKPIPLKAPVTSGIAETTIGENVQYGGTVTWAPAITDGTFKEDTAYTAIINLTAKDGFSLQEVAANFFTVEGGAVTNSAGSGVVIAIFPATASLCTVTFNSQEGTPTPQPQRMAAGGKAAMPTSAPTKKDFDFGGWYADPAGNALWNWDATVITDMTLYAKWIAVQPPYKTLRYETVPYGTSTLARAAVNDNGASMLVYSAYDDQYLYYYYLLGHVNFVPVAYKEAITYNGITPITVGFQKDNSVQDTIRDSVTNAVRNTVTTNAEATWSAEASLGASGFGLSASVKTTVSGKVGWENVDERVITDTYETAQTVMSGESFSVSTTIGGHGEPAGKYRYSLFATTDVYYVVVLNKADRSFSESGTGDYTTACARPASYAWGIDYEPDPSGSFGKTALGDLLAIPVLNYAALPEPTLNIQTFVPPAEVPVVTKFEHEFTFPTHDYSAYADLLGSAYGGLFSGVLGSLLGSGATMTAAAYYISNDSDGYNDFFWNVTGDLDLAKLKASGYNAIKITVTFEAEEIHDSWVDLSVLKGHYGSEEDLHYNPNDEAVKWARANGIDLWDAWPAVQMDWDYYEKCMRNWKYWWGEIDLVPDYYNTITKEVTGIPINNYDNLITVWWNASGKDKNAYHLRGMKITVEAYKM